MVSKKRKPTKAKKKASNTETPSLPPDSSPRRSRGRVREGAMLPVPAPTSSLPAAYPKLLTEIKRYLVQARLRTVLAANSAMIQAYWHIGQSILARQDAQGWGAKVIDRLSADLREAFPEMGGLSPRNLKYMRSLALAWPDAAIVQRTVAQLPWRQNIALLDKLSGPEERLWYAEQAILQGWSQTILCLKIDAKTRERSGQSLNNFSSTLPPADSDLANQIFKDPYLFDFLGTADPRREREVERTLIEHIQKFLLELGAGFAFVGRQVHLEVGEKDFYLDLLFYHLKLRRYVVVELKTVPFEPGFAGQMNFYLSAVDDLLRHKEDRPTIGLLLCKSKNKLEVEYALRGLDKSIAVSNWQTELTETLPKELRGSLPTIAEIEAELTDKSNGEKHLLELSKK